LLLVVSDLLTPLPALTGASVVHLAR
jgi:hypothetical protein